jgi:hypothetical protein
VNESLRWENVLLNTLRLPELAIDVVREGDEVIGQNKNQTKPNKQQQPPQTKTFPQSW